MLYPSMITVVESVFSEEGSNDNVETDPYEISTRECKLGVT